MKTYVIKYEILFEDKSGLLGKEIKIKNCLSGIQAQVRLEEWLKKKYSNFKSLIVNECKEDVFSSFEDIFKGGKGMNDIFSGFGEIFGGKK